MIDKTLNPNDRKRTTRGIKRKRIRKRPLYSDRPSLVPFNNNVYNVSKSVNPFPSSADGQEKQVYKTSTHSSCPLGDYEELYRTFQNPRSDDPTLSAILNESIEIDGKYYKTIDLIEGTGTNSTASGQIMKVQPVPSIVSTGSEPVLSPQSQTSIQSYMEESPPSVVQEDNMSFISESSEESHISSPLVPLPSWFRYACGNNLDASMAHNLSMVAMQALMYDPVYAPLLARSMELTSRNMKGQQESKLPELGPSPPVLIKPQQDSSAIVDDEAILEANLDFESLMEPVLDYDPLPGAIPKKTDTQVVPSKSS